MTKGNLTRVPGKIVRKESEVNEASEDIEIPSCSNTISIVDFCTICKKTDDDVSIDSDDGEEIHVDWVGCENVTGGITKLVCMLLFGKGHRVSIVMMRRLIVYLVFLRK